MPSGPVHGRDVAVARAAFLERDPDAADGVRDVVRASWRRSRSAGVPVDDYRITYHDDIDLDSRLLRCARPVIARLADEMTDVRVAIALSDARARIVHRVDCSTSVGRPLDRVDFNAGFSFAEGGIGTNGIGTVFEAGSSVAVVGAEHFTEALVQFACTGAPITDPLTGRIEGVLDVSSLAQDWTPLMQTLVRRAAADIGHNLLLDRDQAKQAVFEAFVRADLRPRQAVMAISDALMVNRRAQQLFSPVEQAAIAQHARYRCDRRDRCDRVAETLTLASGRAVRLRSSRIVAGDRVVGTLLLLDAEPGAATPAAVPRVLPVPPVGRARPAGPDAAPAGWRTAAWTAACAAITEAFSRRDPLLVLGEQGAGKRTAVIELFRDRYPAGEVVAVDLEADEIDRLTTGEPPVRDGAGPATLVVLTGLDRAPLELVGRVHACLDALGPRQLVAATADEAAVGQGGVLDAVLPRFAQSVTLPPLRFRVEDLPLLVAGLLAELAPGRRVRASTEVVRLLARHPWPGNVAELRTALQVALHRRPVGEIRPADLPGSCRSTGGRSLTAVEAAERDAILRALDECGSNRLHAAAALGMSRSSLYRKLKAYGIRD